MTATVPVSQENIDILEGVLDPKARIIGHRIRVKDIVIWHEQRKLSVEEIVTRFPQLTRGDVHGFLAYYWDNMDQIDASMAADDAFVEEMRRSAPPSRFQEKLKQLGLR